MTKVPEGTQVIALRPGVALGDDAAQLMARGNWEALDRLAKHDPVIAEQTRDMKLYQSGDWMPDFTIMHPGEHVRRSGTLPPLVIMENSVTVGWDTPLSNMLKPNQGCVVLATCTVIKD